MTLFNMRIRHFLTSDPSHIMASFVGGLSRSLDEIAILYSCQMLLELMCAFSRLLFCCGTQDTLFGKPKVSELFQFKLQVIFFITTNMYVSLIWIYEALIYSFECNGMYYEEYDLIRTNYKFESGADNSALVWVFSSPYASISFSWARHEDQMEKYI